MAIKENGYGLNLHFDKELALSKSQVIGSTADVASTNNIELGLVDYPKGKPIKGNVFVEALVGTLTVKVCGKAGSEPAETDILQTLSIGAGETGIQSFTLAQTDEVDNIKLFYTAGTSATITAALTTEL